MPRKSRATPQLVKPPYPSLALSPTPAERRAMLEKRLAEKGVQPIQDFDQFLEEMGDVWPENEDLDEFLAWLKQLRREGK